MTDSRCPMCGSEDVFPSDDGGWERTQEEIDAEEERRSFAASLDDYE